ATDIGTQITVATVVHLAACMPLGFARHPIVHWDYWLSRLIPRSRRSRSLLRGGGVRVVLLCRGCWSFWKLRWPGGCYWWAGAGRRCWALGRKKRLAWCVLWIEIRGAVQ